MYRRLTRKLESGRLVILDGGTGTELQRRGVPMDSEVWCAQANLSHGEHVREVHQDYVRAGAEVITANTYASSPVSFSVLGRESEIEAIDRAAVQLAREAAAEAPSAVAVAGSISVMPLVRKGTDRPSDAPWDRSRMRSLYEKKAAVLADAGCDLLIMEMMRDLEVSLWATEAAVASGLPVWVGISVERNDDGVLVGYADQRWSLAELTRGLMNTGAHAALVMHNEMSTTDEALGIIRDCWDGPIGAYPEAGYFEMPNWVFRDVSPDDFAGACRRWRDQGAAILGGCCGTSPEHIQALSAALGS